VSELLIIKILLVFKVSFLPGQGMKHEWKQMNSYRILAGKPEGKSPAGRPGRREDNIKMDLRKTECGGMEWIDLAQDRDQWRALVNTVIYRRVL
jgi:hypothetical protein